MNYISDEIISLAKLDYSYFLNYNFLEFPISVGNRNLSYKINKIFYTQIIHQTK